jgi:hypothetical protein
VDRHKKHINKSLIKAHEAAQVADADSTLERLRVYKERVQKMFDACDKYLSDPENPGEYDLGPRGHDITVIYTVPVGEHSETRKALLSDLLTQTGVNVVGTNYRTPAPQDLFLKTATVLGAQLELIAKLSGELLAAKTLVQVNTQVNVVAQISPALQSLIDEVTRGGNP